MKRKPFAVECGKTYNVRAEKLRNPPKKRKLL
jgi:hypothetical protein